MHPGPFRHGSDVPKVLSCKVRVIPVPPLKRGGGGTQIVTAFFRHSDASARAGAGAGGQAPPQRLTVLYSHGNAVDLGHMLPVYRCARSALGCVYLSSTGGWGLGSAAAVRAG